MTTLTAAGAWQLMTVTSAPATGTTALSVEVVVSLPRGTKAYVDDVSLRG